MGVLDVLRRIPDLWAGGFPREYSGDEKVYASRPWWPVPNVPLEFRLNGHPVNAGTYIDSLSPARMFATQPYLNLVVSFLARNVAQLGLQVFERVGDTDRRRDHTSPLAVLLRQPNSTMSQYDLIYSLIVDKCLYDGAFWLVVSDASRPSGWLVERLPPAWVNPLGLRLWADDGYEVVAPSGDVAVFPAGDVWRLRGVSPDDPRKGSPTVNALRDALGEQIAAAKYRRAVWDRGGKVSAVLSRPVDARPWTAEQRNAFREDWNAKFTGEGGGVGGTPILEEGMTISRVDFSASDQQWAEGVRLSMNLVAAAFHVNPVMVGQLENATLSNVREFRRMLYGETLGPMMAEIESRINTFLLPMLGMDSAQYYAEFNIAEKLQGSFEEQTFALQAATGAPWMTRNESRARLNLPSVPGGDELITPLNVLIGGQASPVDSGSQNRGPGKSADSGAAAAVDVPAPVGWKEFPGVDPGALAAFQTRQRAAVLSRLGAGDPAWWDAARWNAELSHDLGITIEQAGAVNATFKAVLEAEKGGTQ